MGNNVALELTSFANIRSSKEVERSLEFHKRGSVDGETKDALILHVSLSSSPLVFNARVQYEFL